MDQHVFKQNILPNLLRCFFYDSSCLDIFSSTAETIPKCKVHWTVYLLKGILKNRIIKVNMGTFKVFLCEMTGVFSLASAQAAAAMAINKYTSNKSSGFGRDRWRCGGVGSTRVEKYVPRESMSGQVD